MTGSNFRRTFLEVLHDRPIIRNLRTPLQLAWRRILDRRTTLGRLITDQRGRGPNAHRVGGLPALDDCAQVAFSVEQLCRRRGRPR